MNSQLYNKKSAQNDDVWDDTELIKMYEESINPSLKAKSAQGSSNSTAAPWKVGDKCTAQFAEDGLWYPATIVSIDGSNAEIEYEGYETREWVKHADLSEYAVAEDEEEYSESSDAGSKSNPAVVPHSCAEEASSSSTTFPPSMDALPHFAPPPLPVFDGLAMPDQVEALSSMLMSWYMSGYHTGCYVTMQKMNNNKKNGN